MFRAELAVTLPAVEVLVMVALKVISLAPVPLVVKLVEPEVEFSVTVPARVMPLAAPVTFKLSDPVALLLVRVPAAAPVIVPTLLMVVTGAPVGPFVIAAFIAVAAPEFQIMVPAVVLLVIVAPALNVRVLREVTVSILVVVPVQLMGLATVMVPVWAPPGVVTIEMLQILARFVKRVAILMTALLAVVT